MNQAIIRQLESASHRHNAQCHSCAMMAICHPPGSEWSDTPHQELRNYSKGRPVYHDKDPLSHLYCVREGAVKTYKLTPEGEEQILGFYFAGEVFGFDGLATKKHGIHAEALQDTELCRIPIHTLLQQPERMQHFFEVMSHEIRQAQEHITLVNRNRAEVRIAAMLLDIASRMQQGKPRLSFDLSISRGDMANYLGLTIETISRILRRMELEGIAKLSRKKLEIFDLHALQKQGYF